MDDHRSTEAGFQGHLMPSILLRIMLIGRELLRTKNLLHLFVLVGSINSLLLCSVLVLVLQVEPDRLLEVNLDGSALVLSFQGIVHLDVDLGAIESAITVIECPRFSTFVQCIFKGCLGHITLLFSS